MANVAQQENVAQAQPEAQTTQVQDNLILDEQGIGTLGIILIVVLLLIVFGFIGFSL